MEIWDKKLIKGLRGLQNIDRNTLGCRIKKTDSLVDSPKVNKNP